MGFVPIDNFTLLLDETQSLNESYITAADISKTFCVEISMPFYKLSTAFFPNFANGTQIYLSDRCTSVDVHLMMYLKDQLFASFFFGKKTTIKISNEINIILMFL